LRIDRIRVDGFGRLAGLDTGVDPLPGLVVVLGPNEAGKSTLFAFLTTIFYGFQPATRETNPHTPWGSSEAAGRVRLRLGDGLPAEVERKLRSQPTARLAVGGTARELRNQALPWVEHVPRAVFRQVFAITLRELAGLDTETWARIQDKVVGSMGATDIRSPRSVAEALEAEAGEIWRPNRRGNQRLRDLQAEMRALRLRRTAAHDRDTRLRALAREREAVDERSGLVRAERHALRAEIERAQTLLPLERQLTRIAALRAEGGRRDLLDGLPEEPVERLASLEAERTTACARLGALDAELADLQTIVSAYDEDARRVLDRRADVVHWVARSAACDGDRAVARESASAIASVEARLDAASEPLLDPGWREQQDRIPRVPIAVLEDRRATAAAHAVETRGPRSRTALVLFAIAGVTLLLWGVWDDHTVATALGAAVATVALAAGVAQGRARAAPSPVPRAEDDPLLSGLRLHPARRGELTPAVLAELARVQALLAERAGHASASAAARARHEQVDAAVVALARDLGRDAAADSEATCAALDADLREAERRREAADTAVRESRRILRERQEIAAKLSRLADPIGLLEAAGARFAADDARGGLEIARARLAAHQRADRLEEEVERAYPDRAELEARIRATAAKGSAPGGTDQPSAESSRLESSRLKARLEELEQESERLLRRSEAIDVEARQLREAETVDAVDGELATLREREERLARERDRKYVIACILREADRRFREEHQPDLLRRAGSYLARLTAGRYDRMVVDEADGSHPFRLVGPGLPAPVTLAAPVSTGTLEQAYLALRLAIVDHLDQGGERLPLFVDEVFVNWDAQRRTRGIEVLAGLSSTRQIFVFTCHPDVAAELVDRGGRLIALDGAG
jgi:uncharacterized protein YhaN